MLAQESPSPEVCWLTPDSLESLANSHPFQWVVARFREGDISCRAYCADKVIDALRAAGWGLKDVSYSETTI